MSPLALLPNSIADAISRSAATWGYLDVREAHGDGLYVIVGYSIKEAVRKKGISRWADEHYTRSGYVAGQVHWHRAEPEVHQAGVDALLRSGSLDTQWLRDRMRGRWSVLPAGHQRLVFLWSKDDRGDVRWSGWVIGTDRSTYFPLEVVPEEADLLAPLQDRWPLDLLAQQRVIVLGAGSIGGAAAEALASYGIRQLTLVDRERLTTRNFARHRAHRSELGRFKVDAVADLVRLRDPAVTVDPCRCDVARETDTIRPMIQDSEAVLVALDGVSSRRVANHVAYWAAKPVVMACVLEDGAVGEVLRLVPRRTGCLLCNRAALVAAGTIDPEPGLDLGYGDEDEARPMAAVGGDLGLVSQLAAKAVIATLLERNGDYAQGLPGDHAIIGLRPVPGLPQPFDVERAGGMRWRETAAPREDCPTCGPTAR